MVDPRRSKSVEGVMTACGVVLACGVAAFAGFETWTNDGVPKINGVDHLALYAQPNGRRVIEEARNAPPVRTDPGIDYGPTATVRPGIDYAPTSTVRNELRIVEVSRDRVRLSRGAEMIELKPGQSARGVGTLRQIVWANGAWSPVFDPSAQPVRPRDRRDELLRLPADPPSTQ